MYTIEEIKENYTNFSNEKIREIALNSNGLKKEVIPILIEEIKRRKLDVDLVY